MSTNAIGIYLNSCTGYKVEGNNVYSTYDPILNPSNFSRGIHVHRAGTDENKIYRNNIYNIYYGINVTQIQDERSFPATGLQFICNDLDNNKYDIDILPSAKVRAVQGSISVGADNLFSPNGTYNIYNNAGNLLTYYRDPGVARKTPIYNTNVSIQKAKPNSCPCTLDLAVIDTNHNNQRFTELPIEEYRELNHKFAEMMEVFYAKGYDKILTDYYNGTIENEELLKEAMRYHEEVLSVTEYMAELSNNALFTLKTDSIIDLNQIRDWYDEIYTLNAKYSLAETYYQLEKFEQGFNTLALIPKMYHLNEEQMIEHNNYVSLFSFKNRIRESGRNIAQLKEDEIEELIRYAKASNGLSSVMAQGILCFFYEICFDNEAESKMQKAESDEVPNQSKSAQSASSEFQKTALENITLHPNPTTGELTITVSGERYAVSDIVIYDIYGRKLLSHTTNRKPQTVLDISHLQAGIYFVKIVTEQGEVVRKVVKE
jgi:hypothetical protein